MYSMLKNKMSSIIFHNFKKGSYELISEVDGKEKVYYRDNKLVVLIEDEEVGKRIYDVVKAMKEWEELVSSEHVEIKVTNYVTDKYNTVQMLFAEINFNFENNWSSCSNLDKIQEMVSFAYSMQEKGYLLDESVFDNESCTNISDFLSYFKPNGSELESSNGCIIKYIHYVLSSGGNLDDYYEPIVKENKICAVSDFPYCMPIVKMCYNYYANSIVENDIISVIKAEKIDQNYGRNLKLYTNYLIVGNPDLSSKLAVIESTEEYTVYDGFIKIHQNISDNFEEFLEDDDNFIRKTREYLMEDFSNIIINYDGKIIGYKYNKRQYDTCEKLLDTTFENQREILSFINSLRGFIDSIDFKSEYKRISQNAEFNLETDLICLPNKRFMISKIQGLYNFVTDDMSLIMKQVTVIFFKILYKYLENKYGKLTNNKQLLEKEEVRYLNPLVAKEFSNFVLKKETVSSNAVDKFYEFIKSDMKIANNEIVYDSKFIYNPKTEVKFLFNYEAESKYGIKLGKEMYVELPDKRVLITLKRRKDISAVNDIIKSVKDEIRHNISSLNSKYIELTGLSEIIYSTDLNSEGMYHVVGYVTTTMRGKKITREMVLGLNNREMLRFASKLISNFGRYCINWESILVDIIEDKNGNNRDFKFYCNILAENFSILKNSSYSEIELVKNFFEYLKGAGYNSNAFVGIDLSSYNLQRDLLSYANSFDAYCGEHKIYYDSRELLCPICRKTRVMINDLGEITSNSDKVFEDKYATHYYNRCFRGYNIKIYKAETVDISALEKLVDNIVEKKHKFSFQQDCFIPCKKIITKDYKFVGCLYELVNFTDENCNDLADTDKMLNKARIMSLIRLISQVENLTNNGYYSFINNPFTHVFLCKNHKKQVQILNVEFLTEKGSKLPKSKWLSEYVRQIIKLDNNIQIDTKKLLKSDLYSIMTALEKLKDDLTMYCPIHKMFYSNKYMFCPKCINVEQMEKLKIEYVTSSDISGWEHFNEGGESIIYHYGNGKLAKVFREEINYEFKSRILAAILGKKEILETINQQSNKFHYIIPSKLLVDRKKHKILGYTMDDVVKGEPISSLSDKESVRQASLDRQDILEILITVGEGIETLHKKTNIYIGDLNGRNILFDRQKNVYFLDFDGMGFENIQPLFFTDEFIDPVSRKNNSVTKDDDWYSFAIQAFHYLTYTHPFDGIYKSYGETLDIVQRMECRKSLLGNYGIKPPTIAESWYWMNEDLKTAFYNIFEKELRVSIVKELKKQYNEMFGERYKIVENVVDEVSEIIDNVSDETADNDFSTTDNASDEAVTDNTVEMPTDTEKIIELNSKFIAKAYKLFSCNVERIINYSSAICNDNGEYFVELFVNGNQYRANFMNCMEIRNILILENSSIAFAVYDELIIGLNLAKNVEIFYERIDKNSHIVVNENTLYITKEQVILQIEFNSSEEINRSKIRFLSDRETKGFLVKFNSKFMLVKRNLNGTDEIYCNSEKLCDIDSDFEDTSYNILYDDVTKLWLVVNSKGNYITIKSSNGRYEKVNIPISIDDMKLKNVCFDKGIIYIPSSDCVYIINANNAMTAKQMECNKIITSNSLLCNFNSKGFTAITDNMIYDICKK